MGLSDKTRVMDLIESIVETGDNAEVKKCKDGSYKVYAVSKKIRMVG